MFLVSGFVNITGGWGWEGLFGTFHSSSKVKCKVFGCIKQQLNNLNVCIMIYVRFIWFMQILSNFRSQCAFICIFCVSVQVLTFWHLMSAGTGTLLQDHTQETQETPVVRPKILRSVSLLVSLLLLSLSLPWSLMFCVSVYCLLLTERKSIKLLGSIQKCYFDSFINYIEKMLNMREVSVSINTVVS